MNFEEQLKKAIRSGQDEADKAKRAAKARELTQEELRNRHTSYRLTLSEHIENNLKKVSSHIPGFEYETIYGERGWGGALARDDILKGGSFYSRLEITVRPLSEFNILTIVGKGTIRNREVLSWNHFAEIVDVNLSVFQEQIDAWILQYVTRFSSH